MKISIIGAGHVGATATLFTVQKKLADEVVLIDIVEGLPQGKALDILESSPLLDFDIKLTGSNNYADLKQSDIVVITAGVPRKPGMSRIDLLKININIVKSVTENIKKYAPNSIIIVVTNPLDIMTYTAHTISGFKTNKVFGMAGVLDVSRYKTFIANELNVSVSNISAMLMGGHGDSMVPLPRYTTVSGIPINELLSNEKINQIIDRTRNGGGEIVSLLKTGSAYYAPGASITLMLESIVKNQNSILPVCAYLNNEYGFKDVYSGVPAILGKDGVKKIIELKLNSNEKKLFNDSVNEITKTVDELKELKLLT